MASEHKIRPMSILSSKFELTPEKQLISHDTLPPELRAGKAIFKAVKKSPSPVKEVVKGKRTISRWDSRHRKQGAKNFYGQPFSINKIKESPQIEEGIQKQENFKASLMNNNQKAIQFHRFFHENFTQVRDLDLRDLEKKLDYPRDEIIANFIAYISLSKLLASQNLKVTNLKGQTQFLEKMKRGGLTFDQLRNVFPHLRYENHFIIDKIFNSAMNASVTGHSLEMNQFLKCAGALKCGSFEQKVQILLDVIDFEGKGYLTWRDLKNLCKQSFKLAVGNQTMGRDGTLDETGLFQAQKKFYVESGHLDNDALEEELSQFFADMIFSRFKTPAPKILPRAKTGGLTFGGINFSAGAFLGKANNDQPSNPLGRLQSMSPQLNQDTQETTSTSVGVGIGTHFRSIIQKELQQITIEEIRKALLFEQHSEKSELFQLLCGLSTDEDPAIRAKMAKRKTNFLNDELEILYAQ
ncbi:hypothetical protein FGO68_gene17058 [Halteria grandinella]|uniref:EF-hand domain-containing protein n=1 Tax=Halteria grandinella TaxID=5974 RepID=A0A8J8T5X6_HALGN|nr:hypothetical protein FGO68_gene17058 [Halteria grandinella]